jgi:hypothetical protein
MVWTQADCPHSLEATHDCGRREIRIVILSVAKNPRIFICLFSLWDKPVRNLPYRAGPIADTGSTSFIDPVR